MFGHKHYVPILKGKMGEYDALEVLPDGDRDWFTPLIEIPARPWDFDEDEASRSVTDHLGPVAESLEKHWGPRRPLFIDLILLDDADVMADGMHPLAFISGQSRERGLQTIPVTGLTRAPAYQEAVRQAASGSGSGACFRVQSEDFDRGSIDNEIDRLLEGLGLGPADVDLVLDLGGISEGQMSIYAMAVRGMLISVRHLADWRSFTLASAAFPMNLSAFDRDSISTVGRTDWHLWASLLRSRGSIPRLPAFGDYAIAHPEMPLIDPRVMNPSASIRYTTDSDWLIVKGHGVRSMDGFAQFHDLCDRLVRRQEFRGRDFSWGDAYIDDCARRAQGPGNLTTWRKVGTNHHIKTVISQIASLASP